MTPEKYFQLKQPPTGLGEAEDRATQPENDLPVLEPAVVPVYAETGFRDGLDFGGPLVNRRGEVVGIVTSLLNPNEEPFFIGIGFAVPIETAAGAAGPPQY